jgi:uncharacterized protein (TIGR00299 family) protein
MKILYIDASMGMAGDMLTGALLELQPDPEKALQALNSLYEGLVEVSACPDTKRGMRGTHVSIRCGGREEGTEGHILQTDGGGKKPAAHGPHTTLSQVRERINTLPLEESVRRSALAVYDDLAAAEAKAHGSTPENIHFHEVGTLDAMADIVNVCWLVQALAPEEILCSPVCTGFGRVHTAHGLLPVPAPATAELLKGIPCYAGSIEAELCTPTGAALLRHFAARFENPPLMKTAAIGIGTGTRDLPAANVTRVFLAEREENREDRICRLSANLDDMTPEALGYAQKRLLEEGALDVYTIPVGMKKNRPGILLCCLCRPEDQPKFVRCMFETTETLGIRSEFLERFVLERKQKTLQTPWGAVRCKMATGYETTKEKYEYDDLAQIAQKECISLREAEKRIDRWRKENGNG